MVEKFSRREFLKRTALLGAAGVMSLGGIGFQSLLGENSNNKSDNIIAVISGDDPAKLTLSAIESLGGMKQFVKKGSRVVIKPNIAWERAPEFAATTNPEIVATIVKEAFAAGASSVQVFDVTCHPARRCYEKSGIEKAAKQAGAQVVIIPNHPDFFQEVKFPRGKILKSWPIVKEALKCDCLINVPIAKHHSLTKLTLGIKNLIGIMGGNRGELHIEIAQKLADLLTEIKPHLTIMDAYRVLVRHGPTGGRLEDVIQEGKVIAGTDVVAVDTYTAQLPVFGLKANEIGYIRIAAEMGLGTSNLAKVKVIEKKL